MTRTVPQQLLLQKRITIGLFGVCLMLFMLYVYFLCASVMHVVMRTETDHNVRERRSQISALEAEFIAAQHAVSKNIAALDGYERVTEKVFVDRGAPSLVLSTQVSQP